MTAATLPIRHLSRAPITEAIVDFRVRARDGITAHAFDAVRAELSSSFPSVEERREFETRMEWKPRQAPMPPSTTDHGTTGLFFRTEDKTKVAQFRLDGFTFNRLKPYTSWRQVKEDALSLWASYRRVAEPKEVSRLALRYINHIPLPAGAVDLNDVLRLKIELPPEAPQTILGFLTRIAIADRPTGSTVNVTQALEAGLESGQRTLILDIDAFQNGCWDPESPGVIDMLEVLHELKNRIFFSSLTDATLRQFE